MATEHGVIKAQRARHNIEILRRHVQHQVELLDRTEEPRVRGAIQARIEAMKWAIPVLEAEADNLMRLEQLIKDQ